MTQTNYCPRHPQNETNLRCGKCNELICTRCMVQTPVGARCPSCARVSRLPTYDVPWPFLARGIAAGIVLAIALGVGFIFLSPLLFSIPFLPFIAMLGLGFLIGEGISLATNRKRGRSLKFVAGGATLLALVIIFISPFISFFPFGLLSGAAAVYLSLSRF